MITKASFIIGCIMFLSGCVHDSSSYHDDVHEIEIRGSIIDLAVKKCSDNLGISSLTIYNENPYSGVEVVCLNNAMFKICLADAIAYQREEFEMLINSIEEKI